MTRIVKVIMCLAFVTMLFAATEDATPQSAIALDPSLGLTDNPSVQQITPRAQQTKPVSQQRQTWETYATMPQALAYNASAYCDATGTPTVYNLGGSPNLTSGVNTILAFNCNTETWSTLAATLNHTEYRHAAATVNGKIYVVGGSDGTTNYSTWNQEFDPVAGTVTDKAPLPVGRYFLGAVSWNDSLLYVLGGQGTTYYNSVDIYDPVTNTWSSGTPMLITNRSFACGISGDTIYTAGGYNASGYVATCYMGIINPASPTSITWTQIDDIPLGTSGQAGRSRVQGAGVNGYFYFTGGDDHGSAYPAYDCWRYDPVSTDWVQMANKPTAISNSQCAVSAPALDNGTFLCTGGYSVTGAAATNATEGLIDLGGGGGGPYLWDFEDGWQGWTKTGAYAFPNGWAVKAAAYNGATWLIPSAGDSSMWLDDDEAGIGAPSCSDTALSPVVPGFAVGWLKWGVSFNWLGSAEVYEVGLKYHNGSVWQVAPLRNYTGDVNPMWDSVDVSAYSTYDSLQVYFYYYDGAGWMWYCAFDNVGLYLAATHDVGSVAFLGLGANVAPGAHDIIGVVQNFGASEETYDVHCVVDDNTFAVLLDTTIQVTTAVGAQDTITFGTIDFVDGRTYDLLMATLLGGDVNPLNDTLEQSTYCTAVFWEVLTPMPVTRSGAFAGYATINDTTYIHVFGGNPTASQTLHDIYNVTTATWATGTAVPYPVNYGGHCSIDNKIYLIGSFVAASNPYMIIYDAESNAYTTVTLPSPINDPGIGVVDNNHIYIMGGGSPMGWNPSTSAMLYDVAGDSFITGVTPMPAPIMAGVGGYLGNDTLIHAAGMTTGSVYLNTVYLGYINPANPASITWSTGPDKPGIGTYRLNGASFIPPGAPGRLYVAAGQATGGVYVAATYVYVSGTGWATLPDKPYAHSNWGCTMVPRADADGEYVMYAAGGYTGSYLNIFHALHTGIDPFPGIAEEPGVIPTAFGFRLLTSNPVADRVRFQFDLPAQGAVTFRVFDIAGRQIVSNDYRDIAAGSHTMVWNRTDNHGRAVANGIYFYRLEAAGNVATGKLILVH